MLTFRCARLAAWTAVRLGLAATVSVMTWTSVYADGRAVGGCVGSRAFVNCAVRWGEAGDPFVRLVPQPTDEAEKTHAAERDRKWEARCRPLIAQDRYGVPRYQYAAPGCEFGVIE